MLTAQQVGKEVEGAKNLACEMTIVHNAIIRGINAVYNQARNVSAKGTAKDKLDFANFAYKWAMILQEHHDVEEEKVFPRINEVTGVPGLMDANVDEHKAFHDGFEVYIEYLDKVRAEKEEFDGERLVSIIDSFAPVLRDHLENEIDSLLALDKYSDKCDWGKWFKQIVDEIVTTAMKRSEYRVSCCCCLPGMYLVEETTSRDWTKTQLTGVKLADRHIPAGYHLARQDIRRRGVAEISADPVAVRGVATMDVYV